MTGKLHRFTIAILLLALLQSLFLVSMVWGRVNILRSGHVVTLQTEPIDPRDIFRGDYVRLSYGISQLTLDGLKGDKDFADGDIIHVEIAPISARNTWLATGVYKQKPTPAAGHEIIRGRVSYVRERVPRVAPLPGGNDMREEPCDTCVMLSVKYGIESYFIPQGTGGEIEQAGNERRLSVDVALGEDGVAAIKGLRLDGKAVYEEPLF